MAAALLKWKNAKEEEDGNGPAEPPAKRARRSSPVAPAAENDELIDKKVFAMETCLTFVKEAKETFKDDVESYQKFPKLMSDLQARLQEKKVDIADVITRAKELFQDHKHLIRGFNMYLPASDQITLPPEDPKMKQAIMFKRKVKALGTHTFQAFREILHLYKEYNKTINDVYKLAATLFADHNDLLAEFRTFLPALNSQVPAEEPCQQPAQSPRKVEHPSAYVRENEEPGQSCRHAGKAPKAKEKVDTKNSKDLGKRKESNNKAGGGIKDDHGCQPQRVSARNAMRSLQAQMASDALRSPPPARERVSARNAARKELLASDKGGAARSSPQTTAELVERLNLASNCVPHCKFCEPVEYPTFNWVEARQHISYIENGKANLEKERQALLDRGIALVATSK